MSLFAGIAVETLQYFYNDNKQFKFWDRLIDLYFWFVGAALNIIISLV